MLKYLRLASYALVVVAFFLSRHRVGLIPIKAADGEAEVEAEDRLASDWKTQKGNMEIPRAKGFTDTTKSGREVVAIAQKLAAADGIDLSGFLAPVVSLRNDTGALVWYVSYYDKISMPGGFVAIGIDDATGKTTVYPGM